MTSSPNILLFIPDAIPAGVLEPGGGCRVPNFDRLARSGLRFTNAHTVAPVCSPARASLMTGLLPHNHGVLQVEHCVADDRSALRTDRAHWAQRLVEAGYHTGYFGKWHIERSNQLDRFGWLTYGGVELSALRREGTGEVGESYVLKESPLVRYLQGPQGYNDILHYAVTKTPLEERRPGQVTKMAVDFITQGGKSDKPWACIASFPEPNTPTIAGIDSFEQYDVNNIELPPNLDDTLRDRPAIYRRVQRIYSHTTRREWRELRAVYYALITELDMLFGRLLDTLEATGQAENTIVIVLSDHGRYLGAHGMDAHNFGAFEEAYRVPLIVAGPGVAQGTETDAAIGIADLCPTILELTAADPIDAPDSRSFAHLLRDPTTASLEDRVSYGEFDGTRFQLTQRIVWDWPWKFVFNGFDEDELYNLEQDPGEMNNLAHDPTEQSRARCMMNRIWEWIAATGDQTLLETHYSPMRFAVVGPNAQRTQEATS